MNLTPAKLVKLRREIVSLVGEVNATKATKWCKDKFEELQGFVDIDVVVEIFKQKGIVPFLIPDEKPVKKLTKKEENMLNKIIEETGLTTKEIQTLAEEKQAELKGLVGMEGALFLVSKDLGVDKPIPKKGMTSVEYLEKKKIKSNKIQKKLIKEDNNMKDFWDRQEDPDEFQPFLKIKTKVTYTLELINPDGEPRPSVDSFGNDQYLFDVTLRNISPKKALEDTNNDGYPLFEIDRDYAFSVKKKGRSMKRFKALWQSEGPFTTFSYMRTGAGFQTDYVYKKVE